MSYEIDQSNKIESSGDTALAVSNDTDYTIRIPAREKRAAMAALRWHPKGKRRKRVYLHLFAFDADNITFGHIGKKSPAHKKALAVYRRKVKADRTLKARDLLLPITSQ